MRYTLLFFLLATSLYPFELAVDTMRVKENYNLYINNSDTPVHVDSAGIVLLQSRSDQYQLSIGCVFGDNEQIFYLYTYDSVPGFGIGSFHFTVEPHDTLKLYIEGFDYCIACIGEGLRPMPPAPLTARMIFYTSAGNDSLVISGTQTNISYLDVTTPFRKRTIVNNAANRPALFDIQGRKMDYQNKGRNLSQGMNILTTGQPGHAKAAKKVRLTD